MNKHVSLMNETDDILDHEIPSILHEFDCHYALNIYLNRLKSTKSQLRFMYYLVNRITASPYPINELYTFYFYRKCILKKNDFEFFEDPNPYYDKYLKISREQGLYLQFHNLKLNDLMKQIPKMIKARESINEEFDPIKRKTFKSTLRITQLLKLREKLIEGEFISNDVSKAGFIRNFNGNEDRLEVDFIQWIAESPTNKKGFSRPLLLSFLYLMGKSNYLDHNLVEKSNYELNGMIRECFRLDSERIDLRWVKHNYYSIDEAFNFF